MASRVWNESSCSNTRILDAHVLGYEIVKKRWGRVDFAFVVDVSWSYGSRTVTRRTYDDFFDLQTGILDKFPDEARAATRIIPWLPGRKVLTPNTKKLADQRLPDLDDYVKRLIQVPPRISECNMVLTFFEPDHDAHDHTEESTMLPTANIEALDDKSVELDENDEKVMKKRTKGSKKGGFLNDVDDDDDEDDNVCPDCHQEENTSPKDLEKSDENVSKKRPNKKKGPRRNSRKDGFINHIDDDDLGDAADDGADRDKGQDEVFKPKLEEKLTKEDKSLKKLSKSKKGSRKGSKKGSLIESDDDDDDFNVFQNLAPQDPLTKRELRV